MDQPPPLKRSVEFSRDAIRSLDTLTIVLNDPSRQDQILLLKQREGYAIKDLIDRLAPGNYRQYCERIGMSTPNFHAILNGDRRCSMEMLNKILSGIRYEAQISSTIVIQAMPTGEIVPTADYVLDDEEPVLEETEPTPLPEPPPVESSLLVKPQELQKMLLEFPLLELPEES
jgi:hypothetical protein